MLLSLGFNSRCYISLWCFHSLLHAIQFRWFVLIISNELCFVFTKRFQIITVANCHGEKKKHCWRLIHQHNTIKLIENETETAVVFIRLNRRNIEFMRNKCVHKKPLKCSDLRQNWTQFKCNKEYKARLYS